MDLEWSDCAFNVFDGELILCLRNDEGGENVRLGKPSLRCFHMLHLDFKDSLRIDLNIEPSSCISKRNDS